jgi:CheY-like chemotaxis protein
MATERGILQRDGWDRARVLRLPEHESGYWFAQARSMERLLETTPFEPGQHILDIGANTCWASATFARIGLQAVALDISMVEMQGLRTADTADGLHQERSTNVAIVSATEEIRDEPERPFWGRRESQSLRPALLAPVTARSVASRDLLDGVART